MYLAHQFATTYTKGTCLSIVSSCTKETIKPNLDKLKSESNTKGRERIRNFKNQISTVTINVTGQTKDCELIRYGRLR